ncbi:motility protein A [Candidatus Formimonas warabiya]|uniref:Motility protein A n=2 Tax=Formimonas warabiya TaxID=1761012 RepID=A0A3G1KRX5_FORW1|nr:motility protein A [Candidatus Formimonas warabiya]
MDISTPFGVLMGIVCLILAFTLDGGHIVSLFSVTAALIVFGGTIGATAASYSMKEVLSFPKLMPQVIKKEPENATQEIIDYFIRLSTKARVNGLLSLEKETTSQEIKNYDPLMKECLEMAVDGTEAEVFRQMIENKIEINYRIKKKNAGIFITAGGYAPTMGIIGTVMGLIHVLSNLSDPDKLGSAVALAFVATLYGVASANLFWLPIGQKLQATAMREKIAQQLILEGAMSIQVGENPLILDRKLRVFLLTQMEEEKKETLVEKRNIMKQLD